MNAVFKPEARRRGRLVVALKTNWGVVSAVVLAAVVAGCAGAISFNALRVLAVSVWVPDALSALYPISVDGMLFVATVAAVLHRSSRLRTRFYIWTLIAGAIGISVAGNALHTTGHGGVIALPLWAAAMASAVPPVSWAAALHLVVIAVRHPATEEVAETTKPVVARAAVEPAKAAPLARTTSKAERGQAGPTSRTKVERLVKRRGADITAAEVAHRTGLSQRHAGRILADIRRPRVMDKEEDRPTA